MLKKKLLSGNSPIQEFPIHRFLIAILCYTTNSSQGYSIKIQDNNPLTKNQKIQIDGIDVILKPTTPHTNNKNSTGWSKAWARKKYR